MNELLDQDVCWAVVDDYCDGRSRTVSPCCRRHFYNKNKHSESTRQLLSAHLPSPTSCTGRTHAYANQTIMIYRISLVLCLASYFPTCTAASQIPFFREGWPSGGRTDQRRAYWLSAAPTVQSALDSGHFGGIIPEHYVLEVKAPVQTDSVDINSGGPLSFDGRLALLFRAARAVDIVYLHARKLFWPHQQTQKVVLIDQTTQERIKIIEILQAGDKHLIAFKLNQFLIPGSSYKLDFPSYSGTVKGAHSFGVFTGFVHQSASSHLFVTATQLQMSSAREVFPCVDLPQFKANFSLTLIHPPNTDGLSNMESVETKFTPEHWRRDVFATTPKLPTYAMAFAIIPSVFLQVRRQSNGGIVLKLRYNPYRVNTKLAEQLMEYVLYSVNFFEAKFNVVLPLRKIDYVVIPQFAVQGMENFGLITLNQEYLVVTQPAYRLSLIAHETAHLWFSNLVTIRSWRDICFQEAITDHLARAVVNQYYDKQQDWQDYVREKYLMSINQESRVVPPRNLLLTADPPLSDVSGRCFGKAVFLMDGLESLTGSQNFYYNLNAFLIAFSHKTYTLEDVAQYFSTHITDGHFRASDYLLQWFKAEGYPSIFVNRDYRTDSNTVQLQQRTIFPRPNSRSFGALARLWSIPIEIHTASVKWYIPYSIMRAERRTLFNLPANSSQWIQLNANVTHFYRVNYDLTNWQMLANQLRAQPQVFSALSRVQLINDFCFFSRLGFLYGSEPIRKTIQDAIFLHPQHFPKSRSYFDACN